MTDAQLAMLNAQVCLFYSMCRLYQDQGRMPLWVAEQFDRGVKH